MERPLCPLCKTNHFAREPHVFKKDGVVVGDSKDAGKGDSAGGVPGKATIEDSGGVRGRQEKVDKPSVDSIRQPFDRVAYQREYMRRRRAKV